MQRKVCCPPSCYIWPRLRSAQVIITWLVLWLWEARRVLVIRLHYWFVALLLIFCLWSNSTYSLVAASVFRSHRVWKGCISCLMPLQFEMNSWKCLNHNLLFRWFLIANCYFTHTVSWLKKSVFSQYYGYILMVQTIKTFTIIPDGNITSVLFFLFFYTVLIQMYSAFSFMYKDRNTEMDMHTHVHTPPSLILPSSPKHCL